MNAIEQLISVLCGPDGKCCITGSDEDRAIVDRALEALSQPPLPVQEPVAWGVFEGNLHDMYFTEEDAQELARLKGTHAEVRPLYAAPPVPVQPQRQWVRLTDEEIERRQEEFAELENIPFSKNDWLWFYTKAIEAKLKEKNT